MLMHRTLFRPVGLDELELVRATGMRRFSPRLPEQPFFYPVLNREYAQQIAAQWNTKDSIGRATQVGFVTEFDVSAEYVEHFEEHTVGSSLHKELWVPAEELPAFNNHILGPIRVTDVFYGNDYQGPRFDLATFNTPDEPQP